MHRRTTRLGVPAALIAGAVLGATPALAHSSLVSSTPENGAVLAEAPHEVVLEFDEEVMPDFSQVAVLDDEENHYEDGDVESDGSIVTQAVTELPAGDFSISYRVGSADGHPVTGVIAFTVEPEDDVRADESVTDDDAEDQSTDADAPEPAASGNGSGDDARDETTADAADDEDGTSAESVVAAMAAITVVAIAGVLMLRRRSGAAGDDSPPGGQ